MRPPKAVTHESNRPGHCSRRRSRLRVQTPKDFHRSRMHVRTTPMSKRDLIERIMKLNRSARREFLLDFTENELADYLRQLEAVASPPRDTAMLCTAG